MPPPASDFQEERLSIEDAALRLCLDIRAARETMRLTPARLALKAGITRPSYEKVERGDIHSPLSFYLMVVWRIDSFASCRGLISPEGLKERGRSPVNQLMRLCGGRIKEKRSSLGMTLEALSEKSSVPASKILQMEWGNLWGTFEEYFRVFKALGEEASLESLLL